MKGARQQLAHACGPAVHQHHQGCVCDGLGEVLDGDLLSVRAARVLHVGQPLARPQPQRGGLVARQDAAARVISKVQDEGGGAARLQRPHCLLHLGRRVLREDSQLHVACAAALVRHEAKLHGVDFDALRLQVRAQLRAVRVQQQHVHALRRSEQRPHPVGLVEAEGFAVDGEQHVARLHPRSLRGAVGDDGCDAPAAGGHAQVQLARHLHANGVDLPLLGVEELGGVRRGEQPRELVAQLADQLTADFVRPVHVRRLEGRRETALQLLVPVQPVHVRVHKVGLGIGVCFHQRLLRSAALRVRRRRELEGRLLHRARRPAAA
mmetsp:Transcript_29773/g.76954  ORF Transcript_29773/g.76954 Transcript_29773/m.76954 type:complete len:322 (-) Transcript_29773:693-1658(-)